MIKFIKQLFCRHDYIKVVRCKDCTYFYIEEQDEDFPFSCLHHSGPMGTAPNHFCSYGKRKGGDQNAQ